MGTPGLTQSQAQAETPSPKVEAQAQAQVEEKAGTPRRLAVSELLDSLKRLVEDMNSEGVVPQYRLVRSSVNGGSVVVELWRVFEVKSVDIASEIAANQICEMVELSPSVCSGLRSRVKETILEALGEDYVAKDVAVLKIRSSRGTFSITWLPLEPTEDPVNGGYLAGAKVLVTVELPAYEEIDRYIRFVLDSLEEMLYNVY
jgi:hypothetical protein